MATPVEGANLILKLYELRREPVLREARQWFLSDFTPESFDELLAIAGSERNASYRMVIGYWDMAASFVTFGAIDSDMFRAGNGEIFAAMSKIWPFLEQLRERAGLPEVLRHAEDFIKGTPGGVDRLERTRAMLLARKKKP
jgi:hypothetical protein